MLANRINPMQNSPMMPSGDFSVAAPLASGGSIGPMGGGLGRAVPSMYGNVPSLPPMQPPGTLSPTMAAFFAQMGRGNNQSPIFGAHTPPPFMPPQGFPMAHTGGALPPMQMPHTGGGLPPMQMPGGYDSSGINPHGMYNGTFTPMTGGGLPPQMANLGGFSPLRNLGFGGR